VPVSGRPVVAITRRLPERIEQEIGSHFEVILNEGDRSLGRDDLVDLLGRVDGVLGFVTERYTAEVLAARPRRAGIVASYGVGVNHIDLAAAKRHGVVITNTPDVLTDCTADLAMTLLMMTARRSGEAERYLRAGRWGGWRPGDFLGGRVTGKTLGIIGMGRIGQGLARRAHHGFGMRVLYASPRALAPDVERGLGGAGRRELDDLLRESDFVSVHCPSTPATRHLIDARRLALMRPTAYLVNTARGDVVDEAALVDALERGVIAGAGLDVFEREPEIHPGLLRMENVVLLPHTGSSTMDTRVAMGRRALRNLQAYFAGTEPPDRVA
jgi:lactate dehydrogenase-like 2-hydroxyacid dehydrogenase